MERRCCHDVIDEMLKHIPDYREEFIEDLKWNREDSYYKAPEETLQWERTMTTLQKHIPIPNEDWEWKILSIFTTRSKDELKNTG